MDYDRHRACGRWAELAGPVGLEQDLVMRRFRLDASARSDYEVLGHEARLMLDSYAAGVNAFINSTRHLPVEYVLVAAEPEPWQPWDCLAVFKVRHILMGVLSSKMWRARLVNRLGPERAAALLPGYQEGHLLILPPGSSYAGSAISGLDDLSRGAEAINWLKESDGGSNSWVLSGSRTASGKPLLAGDPHRALDTPNAYYQNHIACPEFDVVGLSFPGIPGFPHFGHNEWVAWCVTHTGADYQDLFVERFQEEDPNRYEFRGQWLQAQVHHETVRVRGADAVPTEVAVTHHGPIIAGDPARGHGIALRYTATAGPNAWAQVLLTMLRARSTDDLEESMRPWVDPCNNFLFADIQGNIGWRTRGQLPIRSRANAWLPVPGWTGEYEWNGMVPFEEMPRMRNPETGYIVTANNRVVGEEYPYYVALDYAPEFRARRITDRLLAMDKKATVADMATIHAEKTSIPARAFVQLIAQIQPLEEASARAQGRLASWDGAMLRSRVEPTIYSAFRDRLVALVLEPMLGPLAEEALRGKGPGGPVHAARLRSRFHAMIKEDDRSLLPPGWDWPSLMARALSEAVARLQGDLGADMDSWLWSEVHFTQPQHTLSPSFPHLAGMLNPPSVPAGGDGDTPQAGRYEGAEPFITRVMSVARYAFDLDDWNNSAWVVPLGASGHPGSPHYADQAPIWGEVQLIPMLYDWARIAREAESHQQLKPLQGQTPHRAG
jgi:penicillin amidase